jgi:predicted transcriptional regulator
MGAQTLTISLGQEWIEQLDRAAEEAHTDRDAIVHRAIERYFLLPEFSEEEVLKGLEDADAGLSSSLEEVIERARTWNR